MARSGTTPKGAISNKFFKNHIINGNFDFWQRNTTFSGITNSPLADRFTYAADVIQADVSRQTDVPTITTGIIPTYSLKVARNSTATPGAAQSSYIRYIMEGNDLRHLKSKAFTVSFWVKSTKTGLFSFNAKNSDNTRSLVKTYTINAANTWEFKTIVMSHDATGTWNYNNSSGLLFFWQLAAGASVQVTPDSWVSNTSAWAATGQVNLYDTANSSFQLSQIMVNEGNFASPFKLYSESLENELRACQRYYEKTYDIETVPGTVTMVGNLAWGSGSGTLIQTVNPVFKVTKRVAPTVVIFSTSTGTQAKIHSESAPTGDLNAGGPDNVGQSGFRTWNPTGTGQYFHAHWTADAEL